MHMCSASPPAGLRHGTLQRLEARRKTFGRVQLEGQEGARPAADRDDDILLPVARLPRPSNWPLSSARLRDADSAVESDIPVLEEGTRCDFLARPDQPGDGRTAEGFLQDVPDDVLVRLQKRTPHLQAGEGALHDELIPDGRSAGPSR